MVQNRILLADDDEALRATLGELIARLGFGVVEACDGVAALELAMREELDFSILDYHMPGLTGLEVLKALRRNQERESLPCILLSAHADSKERQEALRNGAFRFLAKPITPDLLLDSIDALVEKHFLPGFGLDSWTFRRSSFTFGFSESFHDGESTRECGSRGLVGPIREGSGLPVPLSSLFSFFDPGPRKSNPPDGEPGVSDDETDSEVDSDEDRNPENGNDRII
ncbi:MAG: response regulator [Planctomycetota bacterium]